MPKGVLWKDRYANDPEFRAKHLARVTAYRKTPNGQAAEKAYKTSEKGRAAQRAGSKKYHDANPDKERERRRKWQHSPAGLAYSRAREKRRRLNPKYVAQVNARVRKYAATPKGRAYHTHYEIQRETRKRGNGGSHTLQEWREKVELFASCCIYCGETKPLTRDHNIPITRGGSDDIANILPACRSCNARKGTLTAREYIARKAA